jgi:hypothetical protein
MDSSPLFSLTLAPKNRPFNCQETFLLSGQASARPPEKSGQFAQTLVALHILSAVDGFR